MSDKKKPTEEQWESAMQKALQNSLPTTQREESELIELTKMDLLDWANKSADHLLQLGQEDDSDAIDIEFQFASKRVRVEGPLRVIPENNGKPYYISHVIHEYSDDGEIVYVEEGDVLDENEMDIAEFFDPDDGDEHSNS